MSAPPKSEGSSFTFRAMTNPWAVETLEDFNFLCCPECLFRSKDSSDFQEHAMTNHPLSMTFFDPKDEKNIKNEPFDNESVLIEVAADPLMIEKIKDEEDVKTINQIPVNNVQEDNAGFQCQGCDKSFLYHTDYMQHVKNHKSWECKECGQIYKTMNLLQKHAHFHARKRSQVLLEDTNDEPDRKQSKMSCQDCLKDFTNSHEYNLHFAVNHMSLNNQPSLAGPSSRKCDLCLETFSTISAFNNHFDEVHVMKKK